VVVFSQGVFATTQVCCPPQIELIKILGYDATDGNATKFHNGFVSNDETGALEPNGLRSEEYIAVYLENLSVNKVTLSEILLAGETYEYVDLGGAALPDFTTGLANLGEAEYTIVQDGFNGTNYVTIDSGAPELQPGQRATIILALEKDFKSGRDLQIKLTTTRETVLVGTIFTGQQRG
jgi:hypothetical protein